MNFLETLLKCFLVRLNVIVEIKETEDKVKYAIKLILFSLIFMSIYFLTDILTIYQCGALHGSQGMGCELLFSTLLYATLLMGINIGWNSKPTLAILSCIIPMPLVAYEIVHMKTTGVFSQINPEATDIFTFHLFTYSVPCMIVAIFVSYARLQTPKG